MSATLDENLNIIAENETIEIELLDGDLNIIQKLDDEPNDVGGLTAAELKHEFDKAGLAIQKYINETLVPKIIEEDATNAAREEAEAERAAAENARSVWDYYNSAKTYVPGNKVSYKGSSYINIEACIDIAPDAADGGDFWTLIAARGEDGYTPVKGTDYWTEKDKKEIVDAIQISAKVENNILYLTKEVTV